MPNVYVLLKHTPDGYGKSEILAASCDAKHLTRISSLLIEHGYVNCEVVPIELENTEVLTNA